MNELLKPTENLSLLFLDEAFEFETFFVECTKCLEISYHQLQLKTNLWKL